MLWSKFKDHFIDIIRSNEYYYKIFNFLKDYKNNSLLYGSHGFPTDLFIDEVIKHKFEISSVYKKECIWNKDIIYFWNQHFLEIDLMHPSMPKDLSNLSKFILSIIKNKNINDEKHFIIIKHIDHLSHDDFSSFRIILERFSNNVYFLCTTHKLDKIDVPVKSRFALFRMPQITHSEVLSIFKNCFNLPLNQYLIEQKTRDIIKAIFIAQVESSNPELITKEFCTMNFPPLFEFYKNFNKKKNSLDDIRQFSYKCFQYNVAIPDLLCDLLKLLPPRQKQNAIKIAAELDHYLNTANKGREPIYIESFLCQVLL